MSGLNNRVPPPITVLLVAGVMWMISRYTPHPEDPRHWDWIAAGAFFAIGLAFGGSGLKAFRRAKTTIDPVHLQSASVLVTTGIFHFSRNPMYLGFSALLTAWALFLEAPWTFVGVIAFVAFTWRFQILPEERVMQAKFGTEYENYRQRVRRWI